MTVSWPQRRVLSQPHPRAREAPPALQVDPSHPRNEGHVSAPPPTSPPAFLGSSPTKKDGSDTPPKSGQS
jgi:hypothetical protein